MKSLYRFYHKKFGLYRRAYKRLNLVCNLSSASLVACGMIAGDVTINPIVLGTIPGAGVLLV